MKKTRFGRKKERTLWIIICIVLFLLLLVCLFSTKIGLINLGQTLGIGTREGGSIKISEKCNDLCIEKGYEIGIASKIEECLEEGSFLEEKLITDTFYIYDNGVHCCCHNVNTCEEHGYNSRPEGNLDNWEPIHIGRLTCWNWKEIENYICCEKYNLDKSGEKTDITYVWTITCTNEGFDRSEIVSDSFCTGPK